MRCIVVENSSVKASDLVMRLPALCSSCALLFGRNDLLQTSSSSITCTRKKSNLDLGDKTNLETINLFWQAAKHRKRKRQIFLGRNYNRLIVDNVTVVFSLYSLPQQTDAAMVLIVRIRFHRCTQTERQRRQKEFTSRADQRCVNSMP